jgi:hypothetical protein
MFQMKCLPYMGEYLLVPLLVKLVLHTALPVLPVQNIQLHLPFEAIKADVA